MRTDTYSTTKIGGPRPAICSFALHITAVATIVLFVLLSAAQAQTSAFSYQGKLYETGVAANGSYTMKFRLYTLATGGTQVGGELTQTVSVATGIFNVALDFGAASFPSGSNRWLEIQIGTTIMTPRQQLAGSPFAIRSLAANSSDLLSSACNPCVTDGQIVGLSGAKITGSVTNADNATTASNASNLGGVAASNYFLRSGGTITGNLNVSGVVSGDGSGLTNLPSSGFAWLAPAGASVQMLPNKGYFFKDMSQVTATLPTSPNVSDVVRISNAGPGGIKVAQNAGQTIVLDTTPYNGYSATWASFSVGIDALSTLQDFDSSSDGTKLIAVDRRSPCPPPPAACAVATIAQGVWTSADAGATWTLRGSGTVMKAVASSADGVNLALVRDGEKIYTSPDSGATWVQHESNRSWIDIASSASGTRLGAITSGATGRIYISTDTGTTFTPQGPTRDWNSIAVSADGTKWLVSSTVSGFPYYSTDSGVTFTQGTGSGPGSRIFNAVDLSADGTKAIAGDTQGNIYLSSDGGVTWSGSNVVPSDKVFTSVAISDDGTKYIAGTSNYGRVLYGYTGAGIVHATGGTTGHFRVTMSTDGLKLFTMTNSQVHRPIPFNPSNSTPGIAGGVSTAGGLSNVELQYIGNGEFVILSNKGTVSVF